MFSVIIPLYNKEKTITDTLKSALQQTFDKYEVIVVDDGSTDRSLEIAKQFDDIRLMIFSKKHEGVSETRNFGIKKAKYEYIAFLDADDLWEINYLQEMSCLIKKYPECAMFTSGYRIIERHSIIDKCIMVPEGIISNIFKLRIQHRIMRISATIIKKEVFKEVGGFPEGMIGGEDEYTWAKIAIKYSTACTPKVLASYNKRYNTSMLRRGKLDICRESWFDLYEEGNFYRNEFIAYKAILAGIRYAYGPPQKMSKEIERLTQFTVLSKKKWKYLYLLNRLPHFVILVIKALIPIYIRLRYSISRLIKKLIGKPAKTLPKKSNPHIQYAKAYK